MTTENTIICGDNCEVMRTMPSKSIDLVVTSPPYDDLRTYGGHDWDFYGVAWNLKRLLKPGGVIVWVVGDATKNGSETGSSWRQAHHFQDIGLNIHDTMIYRKQNYTPLTHNRYEQEWEYIFVLSNGKPAAFNPKMVKCTYAGSKAWGESSMYKDNSGNLTRVKQTTINEEKIAGNVFTYEVGSRFTGAINHPAMFPEKLAEDHILSWSNAASAVLGQGNPTRVEGRLGALSAMMSSRGESRRRSWHGEVPERGQVQANAGEHL